MKRAATEKIIVGVIALGVIGGGITIAVDSSKNKNPVEVKAPVLIEDSSIQTDVIEPIISESEKVTVTEMTTTTTAVEITQSEATAESVSSEADNGMDYNFWRLGSTGKIATVYFDDSAWEVRRFKDKAKTDLILPQHESKEGCALQLLDQEKMCGIDVTCSEWYRPDYSDIEPNKLWAGGSFEEHIKINADSLIPHGGLDVGEIETQQVNGYETIIIHYAAEYPEEPESNDYYTRYYLILEKGLTMNFGLQQYGSKNDEIFAEFMRVIDSLEIK